MLSPNVALSRAELVSLLGARTAIAVPDAVLRVEGPGAIGCLQGLLTNDIAKLADGAAAWGAFLTPKGMIVSDAWVVRDGDAAWVLAPETAHETMQQLFARTMPPRIATVSDRTGTIRVRWLCGGIPDGMDGSTIALPAGTAPFAALMLAPDHAIDARLGAQGWNVAPASHADALKVIAGWPTLGREIDDRTLPQEVRFDELGGVKYDKGCYTGQETVARLHFRGHANRALRALRWAIGEGPTQRDLFAGEKNVGTLRTIARLGDECIALAILRREVAIGETVRSGDTDAIVIALPIDSPVPVVA
jgi:folate-binding protein YgfZ